MLKPKTAPTKTSVFFSCKETGVNVKLKLYTQSVADLRDARSSSQSNFFIFMQFSAKIMPNHRLAPQWGWYPLPIEILDLPLIFCNRLKEIPEKKIKSTKPMGHTRLNVRIRYLSFFDGT